MNEDEDEWQNPERPPIEGAIDLGSGVWADWESVFTEHNKPMLWHWCDRSKRQGKDWPPGWSPAGVSQHEMLREEPLHLEPSVYWPDCCGKHGFIRNGKWTDA